MDITPTWTAALGFLLDQFESAKGTQSRHEAFEGLIHMAKVADAYHVKHPDPYRETHNVPTWVGVVSTMATVTPLGSKVSDNLHRELIKMAEIADVFVAEEKAAMAA